MTDAGRVAGYFAIAPHTNDREIVGEVARRVGRRVRSMVIGPCRDGVPVEVGVVVDEDGEAITHCMAARSKFLKGWWTP